MRIQVKLDVIFTVHAKAICERMCKKRTLKVIFFQLNTNADFADYDFEYDEPVSDESLIGLRFGGISEILRTKSDCQGTLVIYHLPDSREKVNVFDSSIMNSHPNSPTSHKQ